MNKIIYNKKSNKWIDKNHKSKMKEKIEIFLFNDQPTVHLVNSKELKRIRLGQYRVIFREENNIFFILKIENRDKVYKNL